MENRIVLNSASTTRRLALKPHSLDLSRWLIIRLGELAASLGCDLDQDGQTIAQRAADLNDLPHAALEYAIDAWRRGERKYLTPEVLGDLRIIPGIFFPRAAELRIIAEGWLADQQKAQREEQRLAALRKTQREREEWQAQMRAEEQWDAEHPEEAAERKAAYERSIAELNRRHGMGKITPIDRDSNPASTVALSPDQAVKMGPEGLRLLADAIERGMAEVKARKGGQPA